MILPNNLLPKKRIWVWKQARAQADEIHQTNADHLAGAEAVSNWASLCKAAVKLVNFGIIQEVIQDK